MNYSLYHSKSLISLVIFLFIILISSQAFSFRSNHQQSDVSSLILQGKGLYQSGEYKESIIKFLEALNFFPTKGEQSEIYFSLSLAYYAVGDNSNCMTYLKRLFSIQSDYSIDNRYYPSGFVGLFNQIQREAFHFITDKDTVEVSEGRKASLRVKLSAKPSSDVKVTVSRATGDIDIMVHSGSQLVFTPDNWNAYQVVVLEAEVDQDSNDDQATIRITAEDISEKEILVLEQDMLTTKNGQRKGKSALFIVAGLAAAGGIVAALLLGKKEKGPTTGSIQVSSNPTGGKVYLDGSDTGKVTNCTLPNISPGSHVVRLVKEGYVDTDRSVTVTAGQTATVNITLSAYTITVTEPSGSSSWTKGQHVTIRWTTQGSLNAQANTQISSGLSGGINTRNPLFFQSMRSGLNHASHNEKRQRNRLESKEDRVILNKRSGSEGMSGNVSSLRSKKLIVDWYRESKGSIKRKSVLDKASFQVQRRKPMQVLKPKGNIKILTLNNVRIHLYKGDRQLRTIAENTSNTGSYNWQVDSSLDFGEDYKVRVYCVDDPNVFGDSETFLILSGYEFVKKWGKKGRSKNNQFDYPIAISIDNNGNVYIADKGNHRIMKFTSDGSFIAKWGSQGSGNNQFHSPTGVAVDMDSNVYVADMSNHRIVKYTSEGSFIAKWGSWGRGDYQFNFPTCVAVDTNGNVYVTDQSNHRIMKFTSDGSFVTEWGSQGSGNNQFLFPRGIAVDSSGYVYVADSLNCRIIKFTSNGTFVTKWGSEGSGNNQLLYPCELAVSKEGNVYVTDQGNHRIMKFTSAGSFIAKWGSQGNGNNQFELPGGIAVDSSGNVYVADTENHYIKKFNSNGSFVSKWGNTLINNYHFYRPCGIAVDGSGNVHVADTWNHRIMKFTSNGNFIAKWGDPDQYFWPFGIAADNFGNVYIVDAYSPRIQKFSSNYKFITEWGDPGSGNYQFDTPMGIAVDNTGNVYIADTKNHRIMKFTSDGSFITKWGSRGNGNYQFNWPYGIAVDNSGNVYVADTENHRIIKFTSNGNFLAKWGSQGNGNYNFGYPVGIGVDNADNVFVADEGQHRIMKFTSDGSFITKWGSRGNGNYQLNSPHGVSLDNADNVYVIDTENHRVIKFRPSAGTQLDSDITKSTAKNKFNIFSIPQQVRLNH